MHDTFLSDVEIIGDDQSRFNLAVPREGNLANVLAVVLEENGLVMDSDLAGFAIACRNPDFFPKPGVGLFAF